MLVVAKLILHKNATAMQLKFLYRKFEN